MPPASLIVEAKYLSLSARVKLSIVTATGWARVSSGLTGLFMAVSSLAW